MSTKLIWWPPPDRAISRHLKRLGRWTLYGGAVSRRSLPEWVSGQGFFKHGGRGRATVGHEEEEPRHPTKRRRPSFRRGARRLNGRPTGRRSCANRSVIAYRSPAPAPELPLFSGAVSFARISLGIKASEVSLPHIAGTPTSRPNAGTPHRQRSRVEESSFRPPRRCISTANPTGCVRSISDDLARQSSVAHRGPPLPP
jgi:hypothetical protein